MSWALYAKETLRRGETTTLRPRGDSMRPKVSPGDVVTVAPCDPAQLRVGDVVLVRVRGEDYLHLVKAIDRGRYLIGNNRGHINGWVGRHAIFGRAVDISNG